MDNLIMDNVCALKLLLHYFFAFIQAPGFSQIPKTLSFEWHHQVPDSYGICYSFIKGGFENVIIYLFNDSTFMCIYSSDGNLHPECKTRETVRGRIVVKRDGSRYLVRNASYEDFLADSLKSRLDQMFAIDFSTRIEYSDEWLWAYNSVNSPMFFRKTNFFTKDKRNKGSTKLLPVPLQF